MEIFRGLRPLTPNWGCAPDVDRSAVLYAASLAAKMYNTSAKLTLSVGGKNIWGIKSSKGRLKPIRAEKAYKKKQKSGDLFLLFLEIVKFYVTNSEAIIGLELCEQSCTEQAALCQGKIHASEAARSAAERAIYQGKITPPMICPHPPK